MLVTFVVIELVILLGIEDAKEAVVAKLAEIALSTNGICVEEEINVGLLVTL